MALLDSNFESANRSVAGVPASRHLLHSVPTPTQQHETRTLIDGSEFFSSYFEALAETANRAEAGDPAALYLNAYRLSPNLGPEGTRSEATITDALSRLVLAGADVRVNLSGHLWHLPNLHAMRSLGRYGVTANWSVSSLRRASHDKFTLVATPNILRAYIGSFDPWAPRWDTPEHTYEPGQRYGFRMSPSHDVGVELRAETKDAVELVATADTKAALEALESPTVSIMHRTSPNDSSMCELYFECIESATKLIYIEDQYFLPDVECDGRSMIDALANRVRAGVDLVVVLPGPSRLATPRRSIERRSLAMLNEVAERSGTHGGRVLALGRRAVAVAGQSRKLYIHSKVVAIDDSELLIGSANFTNRSLKFDNEIIVRFSDPAHNRDVLARLWAEHFGSLNLADPCTSVVMLRGVVADASGSLVEFDPRPFSGGLVRDRLFDRYVNPTR